VSVLHWPCVKSSQPPPDVYKNPSYKKPAALRSEKNTHTEKQYVKRALKRTFNYDMKVALK